MQPFTDLNMQALIGRFNDYPLAQASSPSLNSPPLSVKDPLPFKANGFFFIPEEGTGSFKPVPARVTSPSAFIYSNYTAPKTPEAGSYQVIGEALPVIEPLQGDLPSTSFYSRLYRTLVEYTNRLLDSSKFCLEIEKLGNFQNLSARILADCQFQGAELHLAEQILKSISNNAQGSQDFSNPYCLIDSLVVALEERLLKNSEGELKNKLTAFFRATIWEERKPVKSRKLSNLCKNIPRDLNANAFCASLMNHLGLEGDALDLLVKGSLFDQMAYCALANAP
ncbi:MAG: hypothetical protein K0S07_982 [Chlamydiales bacterium]|jgi:hypothetical protein|nr:hypothetical protein [Chlamydiales bacterium]